MKGTLRNFDPIKNHYIFQPIKQPDRPLIVPIETLEPSEYYHSYHIHESVPAKPVKKYGEYLGSRIPIKEENQVRKVVRATLTSIDTQIVINALACLLGQNTDFMKEFKEFKTIQNYSQQTKIV